MTWVSQLTGRCKQQISMAVSNYLEPIKDLVKLCDLVSSRQANYSIKKFHLFDDVMPLSLAPVVSKCVVVACCY